MSQLVDSLIVPECVYRPGSFTGLMTVYESNYIKLRQLTTDFDWSGPSMSLHRRTTTICMRSFCGASPTPRP